jgi:hypothetical protein
MKKIIVYVITLLSLYGKGDYSEALKGQLLPKVKSMSFKTRTKYKEIKDEIWTLSIVEV